MNEKEIDKLLVDRGREALEAQQRLETRQRERTERRQRKQTAQARYQAEVLGAFDNFIDITTPKPGPETVTMGTIPEVTVVTHGVRARLAHLGRRGTTTRPASVSVAKSPEPARSVVTGERREVPGLGEGVPMARVWL